MTRFMQFKIQIRLGTEKTYLFLNKFNIINQIKGRIGREMAEII